MSSPATGRETATARNRPARIIFITGTDTGVGKTLLTALLVRHLRTNAVHCLAMKPFCCGSRGDARLLRALQDGELKLEEVNPHFFAEPVAPLAALRRDGHGRASGLAETLRGARAVAGRCECLLIEGAGGLLVPLGRGRTVLDLIRRLECEVIVVAANRLGTINHTLLTVQALRRGKRTRKLKVVLMRQAKPDPSSRSNPRLLRELVAPIQVIGVPYLGRSAATLGRVKKNAKKIKKLLDRILN